MDREFWQSFWQDSHTPWDTLTVHPRFSLLWHSVSGEREEAASGGLKVLIPACGRSHEAPYLATIGHEITAIDIVAEAIDEAKRLYGQKENITFIVGDFFNDQRLKPHGFDVIYDRAAWCAMPVKLQHQYLARCHELLVPGGLFASIPFTEIVYESAKPNGPPFALSLTQQLALAEGLFSLADAKEFSVDNPESILKGEAVCVWRAV